jgi:hypothetical protein
MGILANILGADNPVAKWTLQNQNLLSNWGAGLGAGRTFGEGLGMAAQMGPQGIAADQQVARDEAEKAERQDAINQSAKDLAKFPDLMQAVASKAITPAVAYSEMWKRMSPDYAVAGGEDPASIREWNTFNAMTPDQQAAYLRMKRATPYLDVGTGFVAPDPINPGATAGPEIVKDNFTPAYDAAAGGAQAKTDAGVRAEFDSLNSKLPGLKQVVAELGDLADKATYTIGGKLWDDVVRESGNMPPEGAVARTKYMSMVDNQVLPLLKDVFGAAFTVQEGESLRATLGAPDKSPVEKKAVLEAFIEQKMRDLQGLESRLPGGQSNKTATGVTWSIGP